VTSVDGWSAAEVARASGVPTSVLREWERRALVVPEVGPGGRVYRRDALVRLQRVLLLWELGVPDDDLATALAGPDDDPDAALRRHLDVLETARERLGRQAAAVRATLDGQAVDPVAMFDGFAPRDEVGADGAGTEELADLAAAWARTWASGEPVDGAVAQALAHRHRALSGGELSPHLAETLDHHGPGTAAYARDALAVVPALS
jgi:MerR family transcriptional regulator, thiopeptide resistance regulator